MAEAEYRTHVGECKICGEEFTYRHRTGRHPHICSDACKRQSHRDSVARLPRLTCDVDGCGKQARPGRQPICAMHYHRRYRTGSLDRDEPLGRWLNTSDGYYVTISAEHPLAGKGGVVREHRAVAYDTHGEGHHPCYWCGKVIDWTKICVDHLNNVRADNRPDNLVISCNGCNGGRARLMSFIARALPSRRDELMSMIEEAFSAVAGVGLAESPRVPPPC